MNRRALSTLLSGFVAWFWVAAAQAGALAAAGQLSLNGDTDQPAVCAGARPDVRLGRAPEAKGDPGRPHTSLAAALATIAAAVPARSVSSHESARPLIRSGHPVAPVRCPRGPPPPQA